METEQETQQQQGGMPIYTHVTEGMLKEQINVNDILFNIEKTLLGKKENYNVDTGMVELTTAAEDSQLINEKGCNILMLDMRSRLTKIFMLSVLDEDMIFGIAKVFARNVRESLFQHWEEWQVKSITSASKITNLLHDTFLVTLQKANKGKYLQYLANVYDAREHTQVNPYQQQNKTDSVSLLNKLFGRK